MWPFKPRKKERSTVLCASEEIGAFLAFGADGPETPQSAMRLYSKSTAVSIPINKVAESFATIPPVLKRGNKVVTDHPLLDLLRNPSPYFSRSLFFEVIAKDYLITNEAPMVAIGNVNLPPLQIQPISPTNMSIVHSDTGSPQSIHITNMTLSGEYRQVVKGRTIRYVADEFRELAYIRGYSTRNNSILRGQSLLTSASFEARQHISGNMHNLSILKNGGRVSLVFHFEEDMQQEDFEAAKDKVQSQYGGEENAGKIGVTSGGKLDIKELGINNKDMDFAKLQSLAKNSVALQYKVPLPLVSNDASTFSNYKEAKTALYDDAVLPLLLRIYGGLEDFLFPRFKMSLSEWTLTYDPLEIPTLRGRILDEIKTRKEINIESDNELREDIAKEPYDGGDVILKPANLVPLGTDIFKEGEL